MTTILEQVKDLTSTFLEEIREEVLAYMESENRNATGRSAASIKVENVTDNGGQLVGGKWIKWVFTGRGAGGFPPISAIIDWLDAKGLPRAMAWAVAKKIANQGTDLFRNGGATDNIITRILTPEKIQELSKNIADTLAIEIRDNITSTFANGNI